MVEMMGGWLSGKRLAERRKTQQNQVQKRTQPRPQFSSSFILIRN